MAGEEFNPNEHWQRDGRVFISPLPYQDRFNLDNEGDVSELFSILFNVSERNNDRKAQLTAANDRAERYKAALEAVHESCTDAERAMIDALLNPIPSSDTGENDHGT